MIELPTIESKIKELEASYNSFKVGQPFYNGQLDVYTYESDLFAITFGELQINFTPDEDATVEATLTLYDDNGPIFGYSSDSMKGLTVFVEHPPYITTGTIMGKIFLKSSCAGTLLW